MSQLTPAMDAALAAKRKTVFGAIRIDLNDGRVIRLLDGAGKLTFFGADWTGRDPTFGVLAAIEALDDGVGDEAPALSITLLPPTASAAADLSAPGMQGSRIRLWLGAVAPGTASVIADPYLLFDGELDQPVLNDGPGEYTLEIECVSAFERLFDNEEGHRLADSYHKANWPGETGLSFVTGIVKAIIWGPGDRPGGIDFVSGGGALRNF